MIEKLRKNLIEKRKGSMDRINSTRENFEKREKRIKAELEEAGRILKGLSKKFKWWQSLP